jgi:hypothetical protein
MATVLLCLTACSRPLIRSPLVQVAEWPIGQARPDPAHCSGFAIITPHGVRVLTAAHCALDHKAGERMPIVTRDRWEHTSQGVRWAVLERVDAAADVAVLAPESEALPELDPLAMAGRDPAVGEAVHVRSGRWWSETQGDVLGLYYSDATDEPAERWVADATVAPGWSGSAVLDSAGRVLGVVTACQADASAAVPVCKPGWMVFEVVRQCWPGSRGWSWVPWSTSSYTCGIVSRTGSRPSSTRPMQGPSVTL